MAVYDIDQDRQICVSIPVGDVLAATGEQILVAVHCAVIVGTVAKAGTEWQVGGMFNHWNKRMIDYLCFAI